MNEKHEGVTQKRLNRLWRHLLKLERLTGMPLRKEPRYSAYCCCPIGGFAPSHNSKGEHLFDYSYTGIFRYGSKNKHIDYKIYEWEDGKWWSGLSYKECEEATTWVQKKIAERDYDKARETYYKVGKAYDKENAEELKKLHDELFPDCPWNGETIFTRQDKKGNWY